MWIRSRLRPPSCRRRAQRCNRGCRSLLSVSAAGFVRYAFGAPIALAAVAAVFYRGQDVPTIPWRFWPIVAGAGVAQILGTAALITAFDKRDFAIGTVYAKTEVILVALFLGAVPRRMARSARMAGPVVCIVGVVGLAKPPGVHPAPRGPARRPRCAGGRRRRSALRPRLVGIRAASTSLGDAPVVVRALLTLAVI